MRRTIRQDQPAAGRPRNGGHYVTLAHLRVRRGCAKLIERIDRVTTHQQDAGGFCPAIQPYQVYLIVNDLDPQFLQQKARECSACLHTACHKEQITALAQTVWAPALFSSKNTLGVIEGVVDGMAKLPGQRTIPLASAELLTGELEDEIDRLIAKALHAEVVIDTRRQAADRDGARGEE
jgi:hypothetical protein